MAVAIAASLGQPAAPGKQTSADPPKTLEVVIARCLCDEAIQLSTRALDRLAVGRRIAPTSARNDGAERQSSASTLSKNE
jgi:hypothetical protein